MIRNELLTLVALAVGCGSQDLPDTLPELREAAVKARGNAESAQKEGDPQAARKVADLAEAILKKAETVAGEDDAAVLEEIRTATRDTQRLALLAEEEEKLEDRLSGFKAKIYRGGRGVALTAVFEGLALAADQADKKGVEELPESVRGAAEHAADLAGEYAGRKPREDGTTDWAGVASDLRGFKETTPAELGLLVGFGLLISGQDGLALIELETLEPSTLRDPEDREMYHVLRGVLYRLHGYRTLGEMEFDRLGGAGAGKEGGKYGPEVQAGFHLLFTFIHLNDGKLRKADLELARAAKAWPNSPYMIYVTGERLAASGEVEKAAKSMEQLAAGTKSEKLAAVVAERARALRDAEGPPEPVFHDSTFLVKMAAAFIWDAAKHSKRARPLKDKFEAAEEFGKRLMSHLPGGKDD